MKPERFERELRYQTMVAICRQMLKNGTLSQADFDKMFKPGENGKKVLVDIKGLLDRKQYESAGYRYWRL